MRLRKCARTAHNKYTYRRFVHVHTEMKALDIAPITVNQFQLSPFSPSKAFELAEYCKENGIIVTGWGPLAGTSVQTKQVCAHGHAP